MLQARPLAGSTARHVYRERLLRLLPDSPGHVVWLHAPLGYGKSILASQWAEALEIDGWRIIWIAAAGQSLEHSLAEALQLPRVVPWAVIHEELASEKTLLVLEDLTGPEVLEPLLRGRHESLILLASRTELHDPELLRLKTSRQLLELGAADLAFNESEAEELAVMAAAAGARSHVLETGGWPLLLHIAFLTGNRDTSALHVALKRSLSEEAWRETLFLAAAGDIPDSATSSVTVELVTAGYLQQLQHRVRLHPLLGDHLLRHRAAEVQESLLASAGRLLPLELAQACERVGLISRMPQVLETVPVRSVSEQADEFLRLLRLEDSEPGPALAMRVATAQLMTRPGADTAASLSEALAHPELPADDRFHGLVTGASILSRVRLHAEAEAFMAKAASQTQGRSTEEELYLQVALTVVLANAGRFQEALAAQQPVGRLAASLNTREARILEARAGMNSANIRFELSGDAVTEIEVLTDLAADTELPSDLRANILVNLAIDCAYDLQIERAKAAAIEAIEIGPPFWRLWAEVLLTYLNLDLAAFGPLLVRARKWEQNATVERVSAVWLRTCRALGDLETPRRIESLLEPGPFVHMELALHRKATGDQAEAERLLELARDGFPNREFRQHWHAARFLILEDRSELDALLELSTRPAQLARYTLLPLASLPRDRPELSLAWPLAEVLASDWQEAIQLRSAEIPDLQLQLLGKFTVRLLGSEVQLPARQQQILTLLALGYSRERIAVEVWPEAPVEKTMNNLNVQTHSMRKALEPWGQPTYFVDGALLRVKSDLTDVRAAIKAGDGQRLLELYHGPLVPELDSPALSEVRASLHNQVTGVLLDSAVAAAPAEALPLLERILELDPLHEEALLWLLKRLVSLGRRNAARLRFNEFTRLLRSETGLEPADELQAVLGD